MQNPRTISSAPPPSGASYAANSAPDTPVEERQTVTTETVVPDERIDLWMGVLMRLADGYPASKYAQMGRAELEEMAVTWMNDLPAVPAAAIPELHRRTMNNALSTFAPSIGDYRAMWLDPAWDFWAEANSSDEKSAPAAPMLPEGPRSLDGPGLTSAKLQMARLRAGKEPICCECTNDAGIALPATLSRDKTLWRCAEDVCGFLLDIEKTDGAPIRARRELARPKPEVTREDDEKTTPTAKGRATLADIRRAADDCNLDLDAMKAAEHADFCAWVNWFRRTSPGAPMNYTVLTLTWPQCEAEMQERFNERLQI